jgi:hypothetical protein
MPTSSHCHQPGPNAGKPSSDRSMSTTEPADRPAKPQLTGCEANLKRYGEGSPELHGPSRLAGAGGDIVPAGQTPSSALSAPAEGHANAARPTATHTSSQQPTADDSTVNQRTTTYRSPTHRPKTTNPSALRPTAQTHLGPRAERLDADLGLQPAHASWWGTRRASAASATRPMTATAQ